MKRIQPDLWISALQGEVKQIVSNLVANAIDASLRTARCTCVSGRRTIR